MSPCCAIDGWQANVHGPDGATFVPSGLSESTVHFNATTMLTPHVSEGRRVMGSHEIAETGGNGQGGLSFTIMTHRIQIQSPVALKLLGQIWNGLVVIWDASWSMSDVSCAFSV
jgi:hypothetical protein